LDERWRASGRSICAKAGNAEAAQLALRGKRASTSCPRPGGQQRENQSRGHPLEVQLIADDALAAFVMLIAPP
jgi:hypothetical protein